MIQTRLKERFASQFVIAVISFEGRGSPFLKIPHSFYYCIEFYKKSIKISQYHPTTQAKKEDWVVSLPIKDIQAVEINPEESVIIPTVANRPLIKLNLKIHLKNTLNFCIWFNSLKSFKIFWNCIAKQHA